MLWFCGGGGSLSLIEVEVGVIGVICVECVDWKRRGDNLNVSVKIERVVLFKVEFF